MSDVIKLAVDELLKIFNFINKHKFDNKLPIPVITIQSNGRKKSTMAWCTIDKVWVNREHTEQRYEMNICAEFLSFPILETIDSMVHETSHLYCNVNNIKDCSRGTGYHNKKFKAVAEGVGLIVTYNKKDGWGDTKLGPDIIELVKKIKINEHAFDMARVSRLNKATGDTEDEESEEGGEKKPASRKYMCPCGCIIRATKKVGVICKKCRQDFVCVNVDEAQEEQENHGQEDNEENE